ncbi:MAG: hypothetical protein HYU41_14895 [Candidatus Rokubacteria bacterium]|nr:hypothetical protein [Candidatus Rokubacteria bacterium]
MLKTRIGLALVALSLSACTAAVAQRDGDYSGQAFSKGAITAGDCERRSRRFSTRTDINSGRTDTSTAAIERDIQSRLYWDCLRENVHQAP